MTWPDIGNGLFEAVGAVMAWRNFLQLRRDREVRGVYWPIYWFYTGWGLWNCWFYPAIGQWASALAGLVLAAGNLAWAIQAVCISCQRR